ncbi:MAG: hypothetical protein QNJ97_20680 [Myxococcota bacterium]|nr:hypothetical protein [Myxococcota bacterium]
MMLSALFAALAFVVLHIPVTRADEVHGDNDNARHPAQFMRPVTGSIHFNGGVGFFDFSDLDDRLSQAGYSDIDTVLTVLGLGGELRLGRLVLGAERHWIGNLGAETSRGDLRVDLKSSYWLFRVGFDVVKWKGLSVYPIVGIGSSDTRLRVQSEADADFDDVLADPGRSVSMRQRGFLLDASLGVDYHFKIRETKRKTSFITFGLRGGYLFMPYATGWDTSAAEISSGPDAELMGPTVQGILGFSGQYRNRK